MDYYDIFVKQKGCEKENPIVRNLTFEQVIGLLKYFMSMKKVYGKLGWYDKPTYIEYVRID